MATPPQPPHRPNSRGMRGNLNNGVPDPNVPSAPMSSEVPFQHHLARPVHQPYPSGYVPRPSVDLEGRPEQYYEQPNHPSADRDVHGLHREMLRSTGVNTDAVSQDDSLADLFADLTQKAALLFNQEVALAKAEMRQKALSMVREIGMIAFGGLLANAALLTFIAALVLGLGQFMPLWASALLVATLVLLIAGGLAYYGIQALKETTLVPEQTLESLKEDKEWLTKQM